MAMAYRVTGFLLADLQSLSRVSQRTGYRFTAAVRSVCLKLCAKLFTILAREMACMGWLAVHGLHVWDNGMLWLAARKDTPWIGMNIHGIKCDHTMRSRGCRRRASWHWRCPCRELTPRLKLCFPIVCHTASSRMRVINHNWSATKQRLHPQSVAEISRHSVLSGDRIRQCETSSGSRHKVTGQCL